ncbi:MAG TPA: holo-ACP synthase [Bacteroidota bacterium]|nr:holo-ACP synthase [Bacteroidota bacterium]
MIQGIGVDLIEIQRIQASIDEFGETFLRKIFTDVEIAYCQSRKNPVQHFAARFAAKEAVSKALSTGWSGEFEWKNVEVTNELSGKPNVILHGKTAGALEKSKIHLTLSHSESAVVAFAVIEVDDAHRP